MSVINTNVKALGASAALGKVEKSLSQAMERLSTGQRINSAKDDAAGLAITNRMTAQIRGYAVAIRNANDGLSMAQTAEGAMSQVSSMLQRMRELSVQAATGTMSAADRKSLQEEVAQLNSEIDNIATKTNHNNIKLLDGSAGEIQLQTGVFATDNMKIGFGSIQTKDIGLGTKPSITSNSVSAEAFDSGDLLINGVTIGQSVAEDDNLSASVDPTLVTDSKVSSMYNNASAIAKVAAINRMTDKTGVIATVGQTIAYGAMMSDADRITHTGSININGVNTADFSISATATTEANRKAVTLAINEISSQTGVTAVNTTDDSQGIILQATDGRNIYIDLGATFTSGATGIALNNKDLFTSGDEGLWIGNFSLSNYNGKSIEIGTREGNPIDNLGRAGLSAGLFDANVAQTVTSSRTSVHDSADLKVLTGSTLIINDVAIDGSSGNDDNASYVAPTAGDYPGSARASSGIAIAAAINRKTDITGVKAVAEPTVVYGGGFDPTVDPLTNFEINGVAIDVGAGLSSLDAVISAINARQGATGVVASQYGDGLKLVAQDGRNISIVATNGDPTTSDEAIGLSGVPIGDDASNAETYFSNVRLISDKTFTVKSGSEGNDENFDALGFKRGTFGGSDNGLKVGSVDISSASGATAAIYVLDAAIENISTMQSKAGAYQNRLEAVVSNLTESNQNMSAARSRILDTDYATETTNLAKSQIIQQAATAMLAQANQSAQTVLALLK